MADIVDQATRSRMMSGIQNRDTKIEVAIRKALFARGFRYRIHRPSLAGHPDLFLGKYSAAVFVHGCYWHGHDCPLFRLPGTNTEFWKEKIDGNRRRDVRTVETLLTKGCRVMTVWECAVRGKGPNAAEEVAEQVALWLRSRRTLGEIRG
jgi:DNA mismatch endonuclease, patch repair protein